ncbi:MAG: pyridoxamine 5'-phosphate oxidase family protein [Candidatus Anammoximicrobium sp.]|nr:pyridoxamine 5'-phosphate oxidase family protein [Candidatus Anammoximicrobium sp.]
MADEPLLDSAPSRKPGGIAGTEDHAVRSQIESLVREQPYAVLCTQGGGQPYGSLVALAVTADLSAAVFATPMTTRKYRLLCECEHVALVIDSRARSIENMMQIEAVTATGRARQLAAGAEFEREAGWLVDRHPQLAMFVRSPTTALFHVDIFRYFHVTRFQEVRQWTPSPG